MGSLSRRRRAAVDSGADRVACRVARQQFNQGRAPLVALALSQFRSDSWTWGRGPWRDERQIRYHAVVEYNAPWHTCAGCRCRAPENPAKGS